jgi:hypothetical protein
MIKHITQLAQLLSLLQQFTFEKQQFVKLAEQLTKNECTITITLDVHNLDLHKANPAAIHTTNDPLLQALTGQMFSGLIPNNKQKQPCHSVLEDQLNESAALRVIAAIIAEKDRHIIEIKRDIDAIVTPEIKQLHELSENPIHHLHQ